MMCRYLFGVHNVGGFSTEKNRIRGLYSHLFESQGRWKISNLKGSTEGLVRGSGRVLLPNPHLFTTKFGDSKYNQTIH